MLDVTQGDTRTRYLSPEELTDIHEGLFFDSPIRAFGLLDGLLIISDSSSGKTWKSLASPEQAASLFWLLISNNDNPGSLIGQHMYDLAESLLSGCPLELRPIP